MATTQNYGWYKPTVLGDRNTWADLLNGTLEDIDTDLKVIEQAIPSKRQTTFMGSVDPITGKANFLKIIGTGISIDATPTPVGFTLADGFANGLPVDHRIILSADETPLAWDGLGDGTYYLYVDYNGGGAPLFGSSTLKPIADTVFPSAPAAGQHFYSINETKMYYWSGAAWVQADRHFVGRAIFSGGSPTEIRSYALNGRYESRWFAVSAPNNYTDYHDIGWAGSNRHHRFSLDSAGADSGLVHDLWVNAASNIVGYSNSENIINDSDDLYTKFGFINLVQFYRGAYRSSGFWKIIVERSF